MTDTVSGVVEAIKEFKSAAGKSMYSVKMGGNLYGFGSYPPKCQVGDNVEFGVTMNGKYFNADSKTLNVKAKATAATVQQAQRADANDPRQKTIARQSALNSAIAMVAIAASLDAIPGVNKTTKTEEKFDILDALVMEKTREYYHTSTGTVYEEVSTEEESSDETKVSGWR